MNNCNVLPMDCQYLLFATIFVLCVACYFVGYNTGNSTTKDEEKE